MTSLRNGVLCIDHMLRCAAGRPSAKPVITAPGEHKFNANTKSTTAWKRSFATIERPPPDAPCSPSCSFSYVDVVKQEAIKSKSSNAVFATPSSSSSNSSRPSVRILTVHFFLWLLRLVAERLGSRVAKNFCRNNRGQSFAKFFIFSDEQLYFKFTYYFPTMAPISSLEIIKSLSVVHNNFP